MSNPRCAGCECSMNVASVAIWPRSVRTGHRISPWSGPRVPRYRAIPYTVGDAVAHCGAGIRLSRRSSPEMIGRAVEKVLTRDGYRVAAQGIGADLRTIDGAEGAADAITELASP